MSNVLPDLVAAVHAAFALFVMGGLILILSGIILHWEWTRRPVFRLLHLAAILFLVSRVWLNLPCPLSSGEDALRANAPFPATVTTWRQSLRYCALRDMEPRRFAHTTIAFGLLTVAAFIFNRPTFTAGPRKAD